MKHLCLVIALIFASSFETYPQAAPTFVHTLNGSIKDTNGAAMYGLLLVTEKAGRFRATDENGEFKIDLPAGEYILTVQPESLYRFKAYIKITETGPNPNNVDFIIDTRNVCCTQADGSPFPAPISLPKPAYPAAGRAIGAFGEVLVSVNIRPDGRVISAKAESGHPLLRAAAEKAARSSTFESGEKTERQANLFYHFQSQDNKPRDSVTQYTNRYTIKIVGTPLPVDTDTFNEPKRTH
ncbi:MAG: energy transducer TonB [Pyrinomonadaceae bacterium]|nr:energy transducer TonB [Pyrinomonadaceae bacterium]